MNRIFRSRLLPWGTLLVITLSGTGCEINSPQMPSFDTTIVVPLGTERIDVMDAVEDRDYLGVAGDGGLALQLSGEPDTLDLAFDLSASLPDQTVDQGLGDFGLPDFAPLAYDFQLADVWPPAAVMSNLTTVVPPFPIDLTSGGQALDGVTTATLSAGLLTVTVTNNLPVPVGADAGPDQISLTLVAASTGAVLAQLFLPRLAAGQATTGSADLAGATLPDSVAVAISGGSPGSGGQPVSVSGSDDIAVAAVLSGLTVSAATAEVPAQTFSAGFDSPLPAEYAITRAVIADGGTDLTLANNLPLPCSVIVSWDQVRDIDGQPLSRTFSLPAGGATTASLAFGGYTVQAAGAPLTGLHATVTITTPGSNGRQVSLSASDGLAAGLAGGTIAFSSVTGTVPAFNVPLNPITETIDLPAELSGLEMTAAGLTLTLTNSAGVAADVALTLRGTSAGGVTSSLAINDAILPAVDRAPATTTIVLDQTNSALVEFLNNLPETITLDGAVTVGGAGQAGTVHADDYAVVGWRIEAPVEVVVTGATLQSDPKALDLDRDLAERINTHSGAAVLRTEILNHLPLAVELRLVAGQDTTSLDTAPLLALGPITVAAAEVDPATHLVSAAVTSYPVISLTAAEARLLGQPGLYTRIHAVLPSTAGQAVRIMSTDFLEFQGAVEVSVRIDDEL